MFSRRRSLDGTRKYSREFFEKLLADLEHAGFSGAEIRLPHNVVGMDNCLISPRELLNRERNYPSLILVAVRPGSQETLKVLFVNRSARAFFVDDTFPSGESQPPGLYFQSPDPARAYAVFEFFYDYLRTPRLAGYRALFLLACLAGLVLVSEVLSLTHLRDGVLSIRWGPHPLWDLLVLALSPLAIFRFLAEPKGLWIKPTRDLRFLQLLRMAARGDFKDNPLVTLVITILGTVVAAVILKWLGLL